MNKQSQRSFFMTAKEFITHGLWIVIFILIVSSCSSNKKATKKSLRAYTANHIVEEIEVNKFDFNSLEAKLGVKVKGDNNLNLKGQIRMEKDSVIWISLSLKVGIEVGRLMITQDSIKFINRNAKTYIAESLDIFSNMPVNPSVGFVQDILVGNDTQIEQGDKFIVSTDNDKYKLEITKKEKRFIKNNNESYIIAKDIWVIPDTFRISKYKIKGHDDDKRKIHLQYDDFQNIGGKLLPKKIMFEMNSGYDLILEIDYSDVTVDKKLDFPFNISKKFDRIYIW